MPMSYLNDEESFRRWLEGRASESTLEQTLESIRRADRFAIQNHMRNMRLWGAPPNSARRAVVQLMAHPAFRKADLRACNAFRSASKLYNEFLAMLDGAPASEATPAQKAELPPSKAEEAGAASPGEGLADLSTARDYAFTRPISLRYRETLLPERSWQGVYVDLCRLLMRDEERAMRRIVDDPSIRGISFHYRNEQRKRDLRLPKAFAPGCYLEANISATDIMRRIRALWLEFKLGDQLEIRYRMREDANAGGSESMDATAHPMRIGTLAGSSVPCIEEEAAYSGDAAALQDRVEAEALRADLDGVTPAQLRERFPEAKMGALKQLLDALPKLIEMPDERFIHAEALVDFERILSKLQEILARLLKKQGLCVLRPAL